MTGSIKVLITFGHFEVICVARNRARREVQTAPIPFRFRGYVALIYHYGYAKQFFQRISHQKVVSCQFWWHGASKKCSVYKGNVIIDTDISVAIMTFPL